MEVLELLIIWIFVQKWGISEKQPQNLCQKSQLESESPIASTIFEDVIVKRKGKEGKKGRKEGKGREGKEGRQ